MNGEEANLRSW